MVFHTSLYGSSGVLIFGVFVCFFVFKLNSCVHDVCFIGSCAVVGTSLYGTVFDKIVPRI